MMSNRRRMILRGGGMIIPNGYRKVKCLSVKKSGATQNNIITDVYPSYDLVSIIDLEPLAQTGSAYYGIEGLAEVTESTDYRFFIVSNNIFADVCIIRRYKSVKVSEYVGVRRVYEFGNSYLKVDNVTILDAAKVEVTTPATIRLFGNDATEKIYSVKMKEKNKLTHNFIPVVREGDEQCGFYDTVAKQFLFDDSSDSTITWEEL